MKKFCLNDLIQKQDLSNNSHVLIYTLNIFIRQKKLKFIPELPYKTYSKIFSQNFYFSFLKTFYLLLIIWDLGKSLNIYFWREKQTEEFYFKKEKFMCFILNFLLISGKFYYLIFLLFIPPRTGAIHELPLLVLGENNCIIFVVIGVL